MIVVKKKMKRPLIIVIMAAVLAVLILGAVIVNTVIEAKKAADTEANVNTPELPEILEGEAIHGTNAVAFSPISESEMKMIMIQSTNFDEDGNPYTYSYELTRFSEFEKSAVLEEYEEKFKSNPFILSYLQKGESQLYLPNILLNDPNTDYEDLYAIEQNDGYNTIPKIKYLCQAIGTLYFKERVKLSDNETERQKELESYGLSTKDAPVTIAYTYSTKDEPDGTKVVIIGDKLTTGTGYYYQVGEKKTNDNGVAYIDYRPYVYATYTKNFEYAFLEFAEYINPILIAKGLPSDKAFEPYLTTGFSQWKNTLYLPYEDDKTLEWIHYILENKYYDVLDKVVVNATVKKPKKNSDGKDTGGYSTNTEEIEFDIPELKKDDSYDRLINALMNKSTGKQINPIIATVYSYSKEIDLNDNISNEYTYEVLSIESILTDGTDAMTGVVSADDIIKISYKLKVGTEYVSDEVLYGVIDLSSSMISDTVKSKFVGQSVGNVNESFTIVYDENTSYSTEATLVITEIIQISDIENPLKTLEKVDVGSRVAVRYHYVFKGKDGEEVYTDDKEFSIDITKEPDGSNEFDNIIKELMGKTASKGYDISIKDQAVNYEVVANFTCYEIDEIKYFTTREEIVSFHYTQASDRDFYYGESLYTNTTQNEQYKMYALNAESCNSIVRILGGLFEDASSSQGLVGIKTVDVVITPEKMIKYGLYSNTINFKLPRGIRAKNDGVTGITDTKELDDYTWLSELGFTLYISDENPITKTRYIASDQYNIIAEIDSEAFIFLDRTFIDFYARRNMVLVDFTKFENIKLEFFMDEISGTYTNEFIHNPGYIYNNGFVPEEVFDQNNIEDATQHNLIKILTTYTKDDNAQNLIDTKFLREAVNNSMYLHDLYKKEDGKPAMTGYDYAGTEHFRELAATLFYIEYQGVLEESDKAKVSEDNLIMRMTVALKNYKYDYDYVYEFYRVSDRRVAVKLYKVMNGVKIASSETIDFHISIYAFKKFVNKYFELLDGRGVDKEAPFPDDSVLN